MSICKINNKGVALLTVYLVIACLVALSILILSIQGSQVGQMEHSIRYRDALGAARSAVAMKYAKIANGDTSNETMVINGIPLTITYDTTGSGPSGTNTITITADYSNP